MTPKNLREGIRGRAGNLVSVPGLDPFAAAMDVCDPSLAGHAERVAGLAESVARRLGFDDAELDTLRVGATIHDVGKVNVRPEVLLKEGPLDRWERAEIEAHPVEGVWLVAGVRSLRPALPYVLFHHERWDGDGYPTRRAGEDIPLEGRVLAVADAFDAMTSERAYRAPRPFDDAVAEVERCAGSQFDPGIVTAFLAAVAAGEILGTSQPQACAASPPAAVEPLAATG
jgi:HD-GYP domain-containing protein (c-di-GMP phosphodiesterase class II)